MAPMTTSEGGKPMDPHGQESSTEEEDPGITLELDESVEIDSAPVSKM